MPAGVKYGGRAKGSLNKSTAEIKALAQKHGEEAINELIRLATNSESDTARIAAIKELLDRGYGKSKQVLEHTGDAENPVHVKGSLTFEVIKPANDQERKDTDA